MHPDQAGASRFGGAAGCGGCARIHSVQNQVAGRKFLPAVLEQLLFMARS